MLGNHNRPNHIRVVINAMAAFLTFIGTADMQEKFVKLEPAYRLHKKTALDKDFLRKRKFPLCHLRWLPGSILSFSPTKRLQYLA